MASQTSTQNGSNVEVIDLTDETAIHDKTITIDDSVIVASDDENANDAWNNYIPDESNLPIVLKHDNSNSSPSSSSSSLPSILPTSPVTPTHKNIGRIDMTSPPPNPRDSPMPSPMSSSPPRSPPYHASQSPMPSPMTTPSPKVTKPSLKRGKESTPKLDKKTREENKKIKLKLKEEEKLLREANRANAANKALENCTANIDQNIPKIVGDTEEESFRTLFDESMINYRLTKEPTIDNSITWTYKRAEIVDGVCVNRYRQAPWIIVVMDGSEYLKRLLVFKENADGYESIKTYLSDIRRRSQSDVVLLVFNLSNHMKSERAKEAKNYRKTFKDRFEGGRSNSGETDRQTQDDNSTVMAIGPTELQDLRLMLEIEFKRSHPKWKVHIEFYERKLDIVQIIVRYSLSIARLEVKQKAKASTGLDWAINMDKERAVDPTKSREDLTKLWITQLQQFSQITLPIAKAIANEYHSPCALLDQYKSLTATEAEGLLAELYVQRNLKRKIGLNISKKIHCFMTSEDPNVHIGLS